MDCTWAMSREKEIPPSRPWAMATLKELPLSPQLVLRSNNVTDNSWGLKPITPETQKQTCVKQWTRVHRGEECVFRLQGKAPTQQSHQWHKSAGVAEGVVGHVNQRLMTTWTYWCSTNKGPHSRLAHMLANGVPTRLQRTSNSMTSESGERSWETVFQFFNHISRTALLTERVLRS